MHVWLINILKTVGTLFALFCILNQLKTWLKILHYGAPCAVIGNNAKCHMATRPTVLIGDDLHCLFNKVASPHKWIELHSEKKKRGLHVVIGQNLMGEPSPIFKFIELYEEEKKK